MEKCPGEPYPIVSCRHVGQRAGAEPRLARRQHHEIRRELESEHLVYLEPPVLSAARGEIHKREQRVPLVEDSVGSEVQDAASGGVAAKRGLGRRCTGEHLSIRSYQSTDRGHLALR